MSTDTQTPDLARLRRRYEEAAEAATYARSRGRPWQVTEPLEQAARLAEREYDAARAAYARQQSVGG